MLYNFTKYDFLDVDQFTEVFKIIQDALNLYDINIATNTSNIATNTSNIATNVSDIADLETLLFAYPVMLYADHQASVASVAAAMQVYEDIDQIGGITKIRTYVDVTEYDKIQLLCQCKMNNGYYDIGYVRLKVDTTTDEEDVDNDDYDDYDLVVDVSSMTGTKQIEVIIDANAIIDPDEIYMRYVQLRAFTKQS